MNSPSSCLADCIALLRLECDRYLVEKDGGRFCLLCSQWADEPHLGSKKHTKRAEMPEWLPGRE